jgi:isopenicillin N synthase-like dioxygenase
VHEVYRQVARFHAQPLDEKLKIKLDKHNVGYLQMMGDTLRTSVVASVTKPNMNEAFFMARDLAPDHPDVLSGRRFRSANQWPEGLPGFREALVEYCDALERLVQRLVRVYARALNLPATYFDGPFNDFQYKLRATHYPSQPKGPDDEFGIAPHTDTSFLTLLAPNDVPGLAFRTQAGDWIEVPTVPDAFIVNGGSCCCVGPTIVSSRRRTAQSTALAASATRWRFSATPRLIGRSPPYRPASAPAARLDTRRPITPTT